MEAFWLDWARNEARNQWYIYSNRQTLETPPVETVEALKGFFRVRFVNGDVMDVAPTAIARPSVAAGS